MQVMKYVCILYLYCSCENTEYAHMHAYLTLCDLDSAGKLNSRTIKQKQNYSNTCMYSMHVRMQYQ